MLRSVRSLKRTPCHLASVLTAAHSSSVGIVSNSSGPNSTLTLLRAPSHDFEAYLLGTAHVSERSERAVRELISAGAVESTISSHTSAHYNSLATVKPGTVMVELCPPRAAALRNGAVASIPALPFDVPGLAQLARQFAFANGRDMRAALEAADACKSQVHCGDLLQEETIAAVKAAVETNLKGGLMAFMNKFSRAPSPPPAVARVLEILMTGMRDGKGLGDMSVVEDMKDRSTQRSLHSWLCAVSPEIMDAIIHRRDSYMFSALESLEVASRASPISSPIRRVVAVVGVGHMDGIEKRWMNRYGESSLTEIAGLG